MPLPCRCENGGVWLRGRRTPSVAIFLTGGEAQVQRLSPGCKIKRLMQLEPSLECALQRRRLKSRQEGEEHG
jgi:hypothetical protein